MRIIAAVDQNWAIGNKGSLLYRIPGDLAHFRTLTYGGIVVYGRNTLATFPDGEALEDRTNLILTHDDKFECEGATIIHSVDELGKYPDDNMWVIGGAQVYSQLYKRCKYAYITKIEAATSDYDVVFPNLDEEGWEIVYTSPPKTYNGLRYSFVTYKNPSID